MDRHELNRMFDGLGPDPEREGELLRQLLQDGARREISMKNWKRFAVAFAAVAVLLGTAAAAHYAGVRVVDGRGEPDGAIWFAGGMTYYSVNQLSEEVKELAAGLTEGTVKTFSSWEAMEEFIGAELMNSAVLSESSADGFDLRINTGGTNVQGRFLLMIYPELTELTAYGCYEIGKANIIIEAHLFTDKHMQEAEEWDGRFLGFPSATEWETCTTPGGQQIQVISSDGNDSCRGAISLNGIPIVVRVSSCESREQAREVMLQIMDSFS